MPKEVIFGKEFTLIEKVIISIVKGFTDAGKDCFVANGLFADICSCSTRQVRRAIARLKKDKLVHGRYKPIDGKMQRVLWV